MTKLGDIIGYFNSVHTKRWHRLHPRRKKLNVHEQSYLKHNITARLNRCDYTCRLPDKGKPYRTKPRYRYRLKKKWHTFKQSYFPKREMVYK